MNTVVSPESHLSRGWRCAPRVAALVTIAVGLAVLIGWSLNVAILKSVLPGTVSMKANTAVTFVLAGLALLLQLNPPVPPRRLHVARTIGVMVAIIGAFIFWECLAGIDLGIDELLVRDDTSAVATSDPGRMAPATTVSFVLLGLALALFDRKMRYGMRTAELLAAGPLVLSLVAITEYLIGDPVLYEFGLYTRMAPHTALLFPLLSLGVWFARPTEGLVGRLRSGAIGPERRIYAALVVFLLLLLGVGGWFYNSQRLSLRRQAEVILETVAHEKAQDIARWRSERLADGTVLAGNPLFCAAVARWLAAPDPDTGAALSAQLRTLQAQYRYADAFLVDAQGRSAFNSATRVDPAHARWAFAEAIRNRSPALSDLHTDTVSTAHFDVIAPILSGLASNTEVIAAVVLVCDATQFLYPIVQSWPFPTDTAESLLVQRDGNDVIFLNTLRHRTNTALKLRIPLDTASAPEVMAVTGVQGPVTGSDYRGVQVLASLHRIPDSPWFLVAKMDAVEALAAWRVRSALILALNFVLVLSAIAIALTAWQQAKKRQFIALYRSEAARRQSESRHRVTLMSIGDGVIVTDTRQRIQLFNPVAEALTGWKQADACGQALGDVFRIVNEYTRSPVESPVDRVLREGTVVGLANHTVLIARDGTERPIADSAAPVHDETGRIVGIVFVFRDQTDERRTEEALREREEAYRALIEGLPDIVIRFDHDARHRYVSSNIEAMTGIKGDAFIGHTHREMGFPEPLCAFWEESIRGVFDSGAPFETEFVFQGPRGNILLNWRLLPEFDHNRHVESVLSICRDVTEHRRSERARIESESKYRVLFESARDAMLTLSPPSWGFTTGNPAAVTMFGVRDEPALTGRSLSTVSPERQPDGTLSADRLDARLATALREGAVSFEWTLRRVNGQEFPATVDLTRVYLDGRECLFATLRDISAQRDLEAQLLQSQRLESIGLLAGGVAHEINNPIMGIMGYADLIKSQAQPKGDAAEYADRIVQLTERVAAIVRNLLAFARQEKQTFSPALITDIVSDTLALVQTVLRHDQIALDVDVPDDLPQVFCRAQQIQQVIMNMITNARDALLEAYPGHQRSKRIAIRAREIVDVAPCRTVDAGTASPLRRIRLTVEDNGPGIPDAVRERMFNPFFTTKTRGRGTGLGLSISHGIVTSHGGTISVETRLGEWTRFHVDLPVGPPPSGGASP